MFPRRVLSLIIGLLITAGCSWAEQAADLIIDADSISYDKEIPLVEASGEARVKYSDFKLSGDHLKYYPRQRRVVLDKGFTLDYETFNLSGREIDYEIKSRSGRALEVLINLGGSYLSGKTIKISKKEVDLEQASFTSCSLTKPHYRITAARMIFYPETDWIVIYWGYLWVDNFPLLPIPTYVYDLGPSLGRKKRNPAPLPEIGYNDTDGSYLIERLVWKLSEYSYGLVSLSYADKKGLGAGLEANYIVNDYNEGNARIYSGGQDSWYGGLTHTLYFGPEVITENVRQIIYQILRVPPKKRFELITDLSFRERINYERVSLTPNLTIRTSDVELPLPKLAYDGEMSAGNIYEESSGIRKTRTRFKSKLKHQLAVSSQTNLESSFNLHDSNYSLEQNWLELSGDILFSHNFFSNLSGRLGYEHYLTVSGRSPFTFENYQYFPVDSLLLGLQFLAGASRFGIEIRSNLPNFSPREIDYTAGLGFHCSELLLQYRAIRREFRFGVNLLATGVL